MKNHGGNNNHGMYNGEITTTSVGGVNGSGVSWRKANERKTMAIMKKKQGK
jgi:pectate lyase